MSNSDAPAEPEQVEHVAAPREQSALAFTHQETEHTQDAHQENEAERPAHLSVASSEFHIAEPEARATETSQATATEVLPAPPQNQTWCEQPTEEESATEGEDREQEHDDVSTQQSTPFPSHAAPSVAPEGRTLEHEVLEDEEMEFHPVPDDLSALSEVEGDEELVLEEETLDAEAATRTVGFPKIADVDEDEVVAAEERGEQIYGPEADEEEEEELARKKRRTAALRCAPHLLPRAISSGRPSVRAMIAAVLAIAIAAVARAATSALVPIPIATSRSSPTC